MKSIFYALLLLCPAIIYAQGNLQFNQIVIVSDQLQTVPAGKVWKVESYHQQQVSISSSLPISSGCADLSRSRPYYIDTNKYYSLGDISTGSANTFSTPSNHFPFWIKSGQTIMTSCPGDFFSVIEFSIVP
jgi:hypothetical protein